MKADDSENQADKGEERIADAFSRKCEEARRTLLRHMEERGLLASQGWRILETTRYRDGNAELVMRPIHRVLPTPDDLECVVAIDLLPISDVSLECTG